MTDHRRKEFRGLDGRERMKPKTDREIVEFLDESVCIHESDGMVYTSLLPKSRCLKCREFYLKGEAAPTPTLEWMLEKLFKQEGKIDVEFTEDSATLTIYDSEGCYDGTIGENGKTPTLALRGAVGKMAEESK